MKETTRFFTKKQLWPLFLIALATIVIYMLFTGHTAITDPTESNYALTAKDMLTHGQWMSPMIYDHYWYDKPIFTYWMLMISFKLFGFTAFAARLPGVIAAGLSTLVLGLFTLRITASRSLAYWSAIILATSFEFWYISHAIITDGYLFFFSIAVFGAAYLALRDRSLPYLCLAYGSAAMATLVKGPVGIILPGLAFILFLIVTRQWRKFLFLFHPVGLLTFCIIALPWYYGMYNLHGAAFIKGFIGLHNYERAVSSEYPGRKDYFLYFYLLPASLIPWTGMTIYGVWRSAKNSWYTYCLCWFITVFLFYNLVATKYVTYTFVSLIPLIILSAQGLEALYTHWIRRQNKAPNLWIFIPTALLLIALLAALSFLSTTGGKGIIAWIILPLVPFLLFYRAPLRPHIVASVCTASAVLAYIVLALSLPQIMTVYSGKALADTYKPKAQEQLYFYHDYSTSYVFYSGHKVYYLKAPNTVFSLWKQGTLVMPMADYNALPAARAQGPVTIFVKSEDLKSLTESAIYPKLQRGQTINGITVFHYEP